MPNIGINHYCRKVFFDIASTNSRKAKDAVIAEVAEKAWTVENQTFLELINLALDPRVRFNTRVLPEVNHPEKSLIDFKECVGYLWKLSTGNLRGKDNEYFVEKMMSQLSLADADIIGRVLLKKLRIGATASTFNKHIKDLIYTHPYMRCSSFDEKFFGKHINFPCYSQLKADGRYVDVVVSQDGSVSFMSRSGLIMNIPGDCNLAKAYKDQPGWVFMGEMIALDENGNDYPREISNGKLNSDEDLEELASQDRIRIYHWDLINHAAWVIRKTSAEYDLRFETLERVVKSINSPNVRVIDTKECTNAREVFEHFKSKVSQGLEGTVVKDANLTWSNGTARKAMKVKVEFDVELEITELSEGTGKHAGRLGSIKAKSSCGKLMVGVGSGLTDALRSSYWNMRDQLVGRIITVRANGIMAPTENNEHHSLFLPRFIELRNDKDEADDLARIKEQFDSFVTTFAASKGE